MTGRYRPVAGLLALLALANTGTRMMAIAVPWFVLVSTGSATRTGLVAAFELAPYVLAKALGGPVVDRLGQRRVSIAADLASGVTIGLIPLSYAVDALSLPLLLALVAVAGALRGPGDTAKHTAVPVVADRAGLPLERLTGLSGAMERGSGLVAPAVAALMIGVAGPVGAIGITAVCFAISAAVGWAGLPVGAGNADGHPDADSGDENTSYLRRLRAGWTFLTADRLLLSLVLMIMVTNLLDVAKTSVLLPVWARDGGHGVGAIGLLLSGMAAFSMLSSLIASWLGPRLPRRITYFAAFTVAGPPPFIALAFDLPFRSVMVVYCVAGLASGLLNPMIGAMLFERIPRPLLGRVGALADALAWSAMPLGGLVAAALIALTSLSGALGLAAVGYALAIVLPALVTRSSFEPPAPAGAGEPSELDARSREPSHLT
jgi:MFS family permease